MESNYSSNPNPINPVPVTPSRIVKSQPLSGWATFMAILVIIGGALSCLTIIGAIFGIPMIIAGNKLLKAVNASRETGGTSNDFKMSEVFDNLNSFFKIYGIIIIVMVALWIIMFIIMMAAGMSGLFQNGNFGEFNNL